MAERLIANVQEYQLIIGKKEEEYAVACAKRDALRAALRAKQAVLRQAQAAAKNAELHNLQEELRFLHEEDAADAQHARIQSLNQALLQLQSDETDLDAVLQGYRFQQGRGSAEGAQPPAQAPDVDAVLSFQAGLYSWATLQAALGWVASQPDAWAEEDTGFHAAYQDKKARLEAEQARTAAAQAGVAALEKEHDSLAAQVAALRAQAKEKRQTISGMNKKLDAAQEQLIRLEADVVAKEAEAERSAALVAAQEAELGHLRAKEASLVKECNALTIEVNRISANLRRNAAAAARASKAAAPPPLAPSTFVSARSVPQQGGSQAAFGGPAGRRDSHAAGKPRLPLPSGSVPVPLSVPGGSGAYAGPAHPSAELGQGGDDDGEDFAALMEDDEEESTGEARPAAAQAAPPAPTPEPHFHAHQWDWGTAAAAGSGGQWEGPFPRYGF